MSLRVYAIVGRRQSRRALARLRTRGLHLVTAGGVSAVVADGARTPLPVPQALRTHDAIVKRIARLVPAILPARFGTILQSEEPLVGFLEAWSRDLRSALTLVERREQMTLRLFTGTDGSGMGRPGDVFSPGDNIDNIDDIDDIDDTDNAAPGTSYLRRRARLQDRASASELEPLRNALAPIVAAERIVRYDRGPLILTAYHLIPRGSAAMYRKLLRRRAAALGNRAVSSGPWPPYAFVPELRR